jgi:hypothetical protein
MFIFLNLALHGFGPENFVPLIQIGKFQKGLIEENESYKIVYYTWPPCDSCWENVVLRQKPPVAIPTELSRLI